MTTITLPERCDRSAAEAMLPELLAAVGSEPVAVDGSKVRQVGLSMMQLLVSARRTGSGITIEASDALKEAADLTGLAEDLFEGTGR